MNKAIEIGNSYLAPALGNVPAAIRANPSSAADIMTAHIAKTDPQLAAQIAEALDE